MLRGRVGQHASGHFIHWLGYSYIRLNNGRDWRPGFTIDLQQKDLRLVLEAADQMGIPLPVTALVFQYYRALQQQGLGGEGNHALAKALERLALEIGRVQA